MFRTTISLNTASAGRTMFSPLAPSNQCNVRSIDGVKATDTRPESQLAPARTRTSSSTEAVRVLLSKRVWSQHQLWHSQKKKPSGEYACTTKQLRRLIRQTPASSQALRSSSQQIALPSQAADWPVTSAEHNNGPVHCAARESRRFILGCELGGLGSWPMRLSAQEVDKNLGC